MERYIVQKAMDAIREILRDSPLAERISNADFQLALVAGDHFTRTAPKSVQEVLADLSQARDGSLKDRADAIYAAIITILMEAGSEDEKIDSETRRKMFENEIGPSNSLS